MLFFFFVVIGSKRSYREDILDQGFIVSVMKVERSKPATYTYDTKINVKLESNKEDNTSQGFTMQPIHVEIDNVQNRPL